MHALVMELVEREDLSQGIARGAIPVDEALLIAKQIAEALLARGVNPRLVIETLGHSQVSLTSNTHSHVLAPLHCEAAAKRNAVFAELSTLVCQAGGVGRSARANERNR